MQFSEGHVDSSGTRIHYVEAGSGPLVLLVHGFPESWYSWRHQMEHLASLGWRCVAIDNRGYGNSDNPVEVESYTAMHLAGDVLAVANALQPGPFALVGHDWGASVAWNTALFRPDLVRAVAGLSVPYGARPPVPPIGILRQRVGEGFYQVHFQEPGVAEAELELDVYRSLAVLFYAVSGEAGLKHGISNLTKLPDRSLLESLPEPPEQLMSWLSPSDLRRFTEGFERNGFAGPLAFYRNIDRNWALTAPWAGKKIEPPALFVAGSLDPVVSFPGARSSIESMAGRFEALESVEVIPGGGHWIQQEKPEEVNALLEGFLSRHVR